MDEEDKLRGQRPALSRPSSGGHLAEAALQGARTDQRGKPSTTKPSLSGSGMPTCVHCHVPMNLCHCSRSACSACSLGTAECKCIGLLARPKAAVAVPCARCADLEAGVASGRKELVEARAQLAAKERELGEARKRLAEAKASAKDDREARTDMASRVAEAEAALAQAAAPSGREAELEAAAAEARQMAAAAAEAAAGAEARRLTSEANAKAAREELAAAKARIDTSLEAARSADEARLEYVAEAEKAAAREVQLKSELAAAELEREAFRQGSALAETRRAQWEEAQRGREAAQAELAKLKGQLEALGAEKENAGALERERAENARLQKALAAAQDAAKTASARAELTSHLELRVMGLESDKAQLMAQAAHAEKLRTLFSAVTSRTNDLQQAANSVIEKVEASKRAQRSHPDGTPRGEMAAELAAAELLAPSPPPGAPPPGHRPAGRPTTAQGKVSAKASPLEQSLRKRPPSGQQGAFNYVKQPPPRVANQSMLRTR